MSRTFLFVGASLEGIHDFLSSLDFFGPLPRKHYAVVGVSSESWRTKADFLERRYGIEVIPYVTYEYSDLVSFLRQLQDEVERSIADERGTSKARQTTRQASPLRRVFLENIGPFDQLEVELDRKWNILLGDNGVGKSSILRAIAVGLCGSEAQQYAGRLIKAGRSSASIVIETSRQAYVTRLRRKASGAEVESRAIPPMEAEGWLAVGFPSLRSVTWGRPKGPTSEGARRPVVEDLMPLIEGDPDPRLDEIKQWIVNIDYRIKEEKAREGEAQQWENLLEGLFRLINRVTPGLELRFGGVDSVTREVQVITGETWIPIEALSQGSTSVIGWTGVVLRRLYEVFGRSEANPWDAYALVLIDEIDAHMHPEWQRLLVGTLSDLFPNIQFISTTHSPLIVGGLPPKQVFRFARDTDGRIARLEVRPEMTMGRADQLLTSRLFGLETTLDIGTEQSIDEYQELLATSARTPNQERRFQELRKILEFRIPETGETPPERKAQELLQALLLEQFGDKFPDAQERVRLRAEELLQEVMERKKR